MELVKGKFYHIKKDALPFYLRESVAEYHSSCKKRLHQFIYRGEQDSLEMGSVWDDEILGEADVTEI